MININSIGDTCPLPVIKTKKALDSISNGEILISVDNKIATENLEKMATQLNCQISISKINSDHYNVTITKGNPNLSAEPKQSLTQNPKIQSKTVVYFSSNKMGEGDPKLGESLMKAYIYTLSESETIPEHIIFYNSAAYLTTKNSDSLESLNTLQEQGVKILTCGACMNFYNLQNDLQVGTVTNMYEISEILINATKTIKP